MMVIINLMLTSFGNIVIKEISYLTETIGKVSEGFVNEIVRPP